MTDAYPRFAEYQLKTGKSPYQFMEWGVVLLRSESERQFCLNQGYVFPSWDEYGRRSAEILKVQPND